MSDEKKKMKEGETLAEAGRENRLPEKERGNREKERGGARGRHNILKDRKT